MDRDAATDARPEEALAQEATRPELLVPITLDYDVPSPHGNGQGIKIRDRFMWNANEPFYKPMDFATVLCNDVGIDLSHAQMLADLIQTQLDDAQSTVVIDLATDDTTPDDVVWSDEVEDATELEGVEPDCRIIVNVSRVSTGLTPARRPDLHARPARPHRVGPQLIPPPIRVCTALLRRNGHDRRGRAAHCACDPRGTDKAQTRRPRTRALCAHASPRTGKVG